MIISNLRSKGLQVVSKEIWTVLVETITSLVKVCKDFVLCLNKIEL